MTLKSILLLIVVLFSRGVVAYDINTPLGKIQLSRGYVKYDGKDLINTVDGGKEKILVDLVESVSNKNRYNEYLIFSFDVFSETCERQWQRKTNYLVVDFSGASPVVSSVVDAGGYAEWADNNYFFLKNKTLYFGVFEPIRRQFVYRAGELSINSGRWLGPSRPDVFVSPDPCFNVTGVEECREEVARGPAKKKHRRNLR